MARLTNGQLQELVQRLQTENELLREEARAAAERADAVLAAPAAPSSETAPRRRRQRGRTVASVVLVVIGLLLAPVALVGNWAQGQLVDTDRFVATFGPLAHDPAVKAFLVDQVMTVVDEQVDFEQSTREVFEAVDQLGLPPRASAALQALQTPAALGLRTLATTVVTNVVDSEAFGTIWQQTLRISHQQLVAALTNDPGSALSISSTGELSIQLGPIIDAVKGAMVAQGLGFAEAIPSVDIGIVVTQSASLSQLTLLYGLAVGVGQWLPVVVLLFLAAGVAIAKRRVVTLFATGLALGVVMVLLGVALRVGNIVAIASTAQYVPGPAVSAVYDGVTSLIAASIAAVATLGFTVMVICWVLGPWRPAPALRSAFGEGIARLRRVGDRRGISTGAFGRFLGRQRVLVQVLIGVIAAAIIVFVRPLSTGQIVWTAVAAVLLLLVVEVLQRPARWPGDGGAAVEAEDAASAVLIDAPGDTDASDDDQADESTVRMELRG